TSLCLAVDGSGNALYGVPAPQTMIDSGPGVPTNDPNPSFGFSSSQATSTFECKLDGPGPTADSFSSCSSAKSYTSLADGGYTFWVRATLASSTDPTPATRSFVVDTAPPETTIDFAGTSADPRFDFSSSEPKSTFECE